MILGTAGHIDHGKTALVRALTGVDTDRLPEEKRRGITIDLGFAPLRLANGDVLGVVDVPGHEAFVRTMLAGASGIDLALLVIAADEGPMPQTREHLAILELLEIPQLVVALTKSDLVDDEWLSLVTEEVRELLNKSRFANAEIIPTSVVSAQGIDGLKSALQRQASNVERRTSNDLFRLPVDRAFTVKGTGTVVTGTVWSGDLSVEETVRIMPAGTQARVRGLQSHGQSVEGVTAGMRAAIALAGVSSEDLGRGATLVTLPEWQSTVVIRADLTLLPDASELRPRTKVRFHLATSDVGARVVAAGSPVAPGTSRPVRIVLDEPIVARAGDRFVLRSASPLATIGGGVITDPNAARRARPMPALEMPSHHVLTIFTEEAGLHGLAESTLPVRLGVPPAPVKSFAISTTGLSRVAGRWYSDLGLSAARAKVLELVKTHHAQHPLDTGVPRQEIRSRVGIDQPLFDELVGELTARKKLEATGAELRLPGKGGQLSDAQRKVTDDILAALDTAGSEPPSVSELQDRFGPQTASLLRHLEREHRVVQVEDTRFYTPNAVRELLRRLESGMSGRGELAPTDLREVLGFSRKFLIPFLEYCDRKGYTLRQGNGRIWRGVAGGTPG
ncbi:MAG: selenocysteine-specific translation elongation factor [Gemmatimonadaceae bacterium]